MQIYYDSEYVDELTQRIYKQFMEDAQNRQRVHMSDLGYCHIKCWCRLMGFTPFPFTPRSVGIMMIGVVGQEIIQNVYPSEWSEWELDNPPAHIDVYVQEEESFPLEIKFSRKAVYRGDDLSHGWLSQATGYMAKLDEPLGRFAIMNVMNGSLNAFKIEMTLDELQARRDKIDSDEALIYKCVEDKNPFPLEIDVGHCKWCDYRDTRGRTKHDLGRGCPRYKGRTTAHLDQFLPSS